MCLFSTANHGTKTFFWWHATKTITITVNQAKQDKAHITGMGNCQHHKHTVSRRLSNSYNTSIFVASKRETLFTVKLLLQTDKRKEHSGSCQTGKSKSNCFRISMNNFPLAPMNSLNLAVCYLASLRYAFKGTSFLVTLCVIYHHTTGAAMGNGCSVQTEGLIGHQAHRGWSLEKKQSAKDFWHSLCLILCHS